MSKKLGMIIVGGGVIALLVWGYWWGQKWWMRRNLVWVKPEAETGIPEKIARLEKLKFENLAVRKPEVSEIKLERVLGEEENYTSYLFSFDTEGKRVTGWTNIPGKAGGEQPRNQTDSKTDNETDSVSSGSEILKPVQNDETEKWVDQESLDSAQGRTENGVDLSVEISPSISWGRNDKEADAVPAQGEAKRVGITRGGKKYPVIVVIRGYVDKEIYQTGVGTWKAAGVLADNGYVTLAPDFLGYGESDGENEYPLAARFERPLTVLNLMAAIGSLPMADEQRVGIWAHSNGGQIALSVLEITKGEYPTTLWAPVSIGFPESILNYTDELPDKGEYLKGLVREFETYYLPERFSIDNYWNRIRAPIQIHQGTGDEEVSVEWSRALVEKLKDRKTERPMNGETEKLINKGAEEQEGNKITMSDQSEPTEPDSHEIKVQYYEYLGDNHNFAKGNWTRVIGRDVEFFGKMLK
jgi:dienelactone hydrolase